ncbi:MAG TPA: hypothetical protein VI159_08935, partial [Gemmatimonadales bacterium]
MTRARVLRFGAMRHLVVVAALVASAAAFAAAPVARAASPTISFAGEGRIYTFSGTFTLDHFAVKTPINTYFDGTLQPHLMAVGTVSGTVISPFGSAATFTDQPFMWVEVTVSATCGGNITLTLNPLNGTDYAGGIGGAPPLFWDSSVPLPPWDSGVHWGMTSPATSVTLTSNLACAVARV